ncbi:hypothetical protein ABFS82_08G154300 [Erythranthe guttata]
MADLPPELVEDILRCLPVKTLKRFRAVAKSWRSLIDGDDFAKLHLRHSLTTNSNRNLIIGGIGVYTVALDSLDGAHPIKPPFYYKTVDEISNSCNGVVLVMSEPPILWNPYSADYKVLPDCPVERAAPDGCYCMTGFGFGYDSRNDDYKVVRVTEFRHIINHSSMANVASIYSHRSNSWRGIDPVPYPLTFSRGSWRVHVNGALHSLAQDSGSVLGLIIMGFSLETEMHYPMAMPDGVRVRGFVLTLDVVGDRLALVCTSRYRAVIWVMEEYGVADSWVELVALRCPAIERNDFVTPLVYSKEGDRVLLNCDDKRLVWYDLRTKSVDYVTVKGLPFAFYAEACVESLVSLGGGGRGKIKNSKLEKDERKENIRRKRDDFLSKGFKLVL